MEWSDEKKEKLFERLTRCLNLPSDCSIASEIMISEAENAWMSKDYVTCNSLTAYLLGEAPFSDS